MDYTDKIDRGVAYLNEAHTDWFLRCVDLDSLDMANPWRCILGKLHGHFGEYLVDHDKSIGWAAEHGFTTFTDPEMGSNFEDLTWQWKVRINDLRLTAGITS